MLCFVDLQPFSLVTAVLTQWAMKGKAKVRSVNYAWFQKFEFSFPRLPSYPSAHLTCQHQSLERSSKSLLLIDHQQGIDVYFRFTFTFPDKISPTPTIM